MNAGEASQILDTIAGETGSCQFMTQVGERYHVDSKLMVVGKAINGWSRPSGRPNQWIEANWQNSNGYATGRSAFWRFVRDVAIDLGPPTTGWSQYLAWSNLYRLSPADGGNPDTALCNRQFDACAELLSHDLQRLQPRRLLALTTWGWFQHFSSALEGLGWSWTEREPNVPAGARGTLQLSATLRFGASGAPIAVHVTSHPQGKSTTALRQARELIV